MSDFIGRYLNKIDKKGRVSVPAVWRPRLTREDFSGIVMFATNLAKNFDPAFRRRISTHIEIPIPDLKARKSLWNIKIPEIMPGKENLDLDELAKETKGLTGAEIQNAVIKAATIAVQRSGNKQKLTMDDIMIAVDVEKRAKKDVGSPH